MRHTVSIRPVARKSHRCSVCGRTIFKGEKYQRSSVLDQGTAWTVKDCLHCARTLTEFFTTHPNREDDMTIEVVLEWLQEDYHPTYCSIRAGWRWPNGELMYLPFEKTA